MTRETAPEAIDQLQRRKLELEVEIHALEREKDEASKERLKIARKAIADVEEQLQPLLAQYEAEKQRGEEINHVRRKIDELKAKGKFVRITAAGLKESHPHDVQIVVEYPLAGPVTVRRSRTMSLPASSPVTPEESLP